MSEKAGEVWDGSKSLTGVHMILRPDPNLSGFFFFSLFRFFNAVTLRRGVYENFSWFECSVYLKSNLFPANNSMMTDHFN